MRRVALIFIFLFFPYFVQAQCFDNGYTVVFVNGILNTRVQAEKSKRALELELGEKFNNESISVRLGYNESHVGGLGDLTQLFAQSFFSSVSDFDRDTILLQIHPEVTTKKILLVGHSQGSFYANKIYSYLTAEGGKDKSAVGVYNVANLANYVAGGGSYITSVADGMVLAYNEMARQTGGLLALPANAQLDPAAAIGNGHSFTDVYIQYGGERIVGDTTRALTRLVPDMEHATGCFTPPEVGVGYKTQQAFFAVADPAAIGVKGAAEGAYKGAVAVKDATVAAAGAAAGAAQSLFAWFVPAPRTENLPGSFTVVKSIYGSSVDEKDLEELLGTSQSGAVALANAPSKKPEVKKEIPTPEPKGEGAVLGAETERPAEPAIPAPQLQSVESPGFGGGGGNVSPALSTDIGISEATDEASTTEDAEEANIPKPEPEPEPINLLGEQLLRSVPNGASDHLFQTFTPAIGDVVRSVCYFAQASTDVTLFAYITTEPRGGELYADQGYRGDGTAREYCFSFTNIQDGYAVAASTTYNAALYTQGGSAQWYGSAEDVYTGGAALDQSNQGPVKDFYFKLGSSTSAAHHPLLLSITSNGSALTGGFSTKKLATTTHSIALVLTYSEDISVPPEVTIGTQQSVTDCADSNPRTFCVVYVPPDNTETFLQYLVISAAATAGAAVPPGAYVFLQIDTRAPLIEQLGGIAEGGVASTTETVGITYKVTNGERISARCAFDDAPLKSCRTLTTAVGGPFAEGAHYFTIEATDIYGHTTTLVRNFTVIP